ncbi:MAG TPA: hypothetical protein P5026_07780 [Kiritimatiellia bacterium]|nr:hypothetical protein [Kiritimatiellia bacterium]HRU70190.1 hypothetical protein [Kiritimatiellia bacterium]
MKKEIQVTESTLDALLGFLSNFINVFDTEWADYTLGSIKNEFREPSEATFLHPCVADESDNWANRGCLLTSYRKLLECLSVTEDELMGMCIGQTDISLKDYWRDLAVSQQETIAGLTRLLSANQKGTAPAGDGGHDATKTA